MEILFFDKCIASDIENFRAMCQRCVEIYKTNRNYFIPYISLNCLEVILMYLLQNTEIVIGIVRILENTQIG